MLLYCTRFSAYRIHTCIVSYRIVFVLAVLLLALTGYFLFLPVYNIHISTHSHIYRLNTHYAIYLYQSSNQCACVCMMWLNRGTVYKRISLNVIISSFLFISQSHTPLWLVRSFTFARVRCIYVYCLLLFIVFDLTSYYCSIAYETKA